MIRSIPTPSISIVHLGPFSVHLYALCIMSGVAVAIYLGNKRFTSRFSETAGVVADVAIVAVPAGVVGGRLYHVITTPEKYFGSRGNFLDIVKIWEGGLGIWGAIALGAVGAYFSYRHLGRSRRLPQFKYFADAIAPGIVFAQAIGRWGNWFNAELFGKPTNLPWALEIPHWARPSGYSEVELFHPTFLYESLWCFIVGIVLIFMSGKLRGGQLFSLYIFSYCLGRLFFEYLRIDPAHNFAGIRINIFVSLFGMIFSLVIFRRFSRSTQ